VDLSWNRSIVGKYGELLQFLANLITVVLFLIGSAVFVSSYINGGYNFYNNLPLVYISTPKQK